MLVWMRARVPQAVCGQRAWVITNIVKTWESIYDARTHTRMSALLTRGNGSLDGDPVKV